MDKFNHEGSRQSTLFPRIPPKAYRITGILNIIQPVWNDGSPERQKRESQKDSASGVENEWESGVWYTQSGA